MAKKKEVEKNEDYMYDPCPIVDKLEGKQKGLYKLQGMCFLLEHFPELKTTCPGCQYFKEIPPNSYTCKRFYCTLDK